MTKENVIEKLKKIKAMADGAAAIGSEEEAQAFAEKLQKMLFEHKLEMTDLEFEQFEKEQPVTTHRINYEQYPEIRLRSTRVEWIEKLASIVARAHFCRILVHPKSSRITLVGRKNDVEICEYMLITLQRAVEKISKTAVYQYMLECKRERMPLEHGFRETFILAFIDRLMKRFDEERRVFTSDCTALVRVNNSEVAVAAFMKSMRTKSASRLSNHVTWNSEGHRRGQAAADAVNLRANVMKAGNIGPNKLIA
jgi:hypothetical protein